MKRVAVLRKTDGVQLGTMPASVGMATSQGTVAKVNEKTVTNDKGWRSDGIVGITLAEARKYGWPKAQGCSVFKA